ncbi:hypothetical protein P8C59_006302 [Phyllachora maydis]|uniref:Ras-GEF domain-containing protein n=1 Tax=Phyllachora maydis TaxID=1825666 RepID=A0AAD9I7V8_9PEZI|nr:hypothetical protein P8C59_006302 [Phyllachora maydis]
MYCSVGCSRIHHAKHLPVPEVPPKAAAPEPETPKTFQQHDPYKILLDHSADIQRLFKKHPDLKTALVDIQRATDPPAESHRHFTSPMLVRKAFKVHIDEVLLRIGGKKLEPCTAGVIFQCGPRQIVDKTPFPRTINRGCASELLCCLLGGVPVAGGQARGFSEGPVHRDDAVVSDCPQAEKVTDRGATHFASVSAFASASASASAAVAIAIAIDVAIFAVRTAPALASAAQRVPSPAELHVLDRPTAPRSAAAAAAAAAASMEPINIAVIGANGVGKSAFVQRALRLPRPPILNTTSLRQDFEGVPYVVTLIELDLEVFDVDPAQPVQWPKQISGHTLPPMDGVLMLYDVMNKDSIRDLPQTMAALAHSSLPTIIVATKCDAPENVRQLDTSGVASAFPTCICDFKTSVNVPNSARECLQAMLKAAITSRCGKRAEPQPPRRRAVSVANLEAPPNTPHSRPASEHSIAKHSRASAEFSLLRGVAAASDGHPRAQSRSPRPEHRNQASHIATSPASDAPDDGTRQTVWSMLRTPGVRLDAAQDSFLDVDESDADSYRYSDDIPILQRNDEGVPERPAKPLFSAILARLDRVKADDTAHYLTKTETQLRIVEAVAKWLSQYPGDFARPTTKRKLEDLVRHFSTEPVFSAAAQQMRADLETKVVENDDTGWARSDDIEDEESTIDEARSSQADSRRPSEMADSMSSVQVDDSASSVPRRVSQSSELSMSDREAGRSPARFQFHSFEDYEREAATIVTTATLSLNKFRYHIFMDIDSDDMAEEMTRMDWVMFSSIRIRDLVRHVSLSMEQRERCRSLKNVNRMIQHFNHIAQWVANMVLIRDKAKHRAPCLEKFMVIALKLRQLNNYNGLAAVLAGINGTAVHRLAQTRALVSHDVQKRFARLVLLMGSHKSHFAYRLAWENSPLPRIPFIPLHRRDLVSAEEGSRTFVGPGGDRINWRKFEVLGEVLLPVMRSQGQPYPNLNRHEASRELILDCRIVGDDEDLYQRSVQVEPTSSIGAESTRKKFAWLVK